MYLLLKQLKLSNVHFWLGCAQSKSCVLFSLFLLFASTQANKFQKSEVSFFTLYKVEYGKNSSYTKFHL